MKLSQIVTELGLERLNGTEFEEDYDISSGYVSDLLSQVLASAKSDSIWLTIQSHMNIIGVAVMANIKAIVVCENHDVPDEVISKADSEKVTILRSQENAYILAGKLYERGIQ